MAVANILCIISMGGGGSLPDPGTEPVNAKLDALPTVANGRNDLFGESE